MCIRHRSRNLRFQRLSIFDDTLCLQNQTNSVFSIETPEAYLYFYFKYSYYFLYCLFVTTGLSPLFLKSLPDSPIFVYPENIKNTNISYLCKEINPSNLALRSPFCCLRKPTNLTLSFTTFSKSSTLWPRSFCKWKLLGDWMLRVELD